ncbi:MAG: adenylate/guanylate cyclase domain-containing protein [Gemmatimonadales bacterium]|nr:MAG: adenylate/guanylate cyclase domain-containing protein [Gemmatimonadales bacterium]
MVTSDYERQDGNEELWYQVFAKGHPLLAGKQRRFSLLPGNPRCKLCMAPLGGMGGWLMRLRHISRSERNPTYCNTCDGFLEAFPGGAEVPISMMMIDIRDSVGLSARNSPREFARLVGGMREDVMEILRKTDGFVLEFQGDSVFAVWPPGFVGETHASKAVTAAEEAVQRFARLNSDASNADASKVAVGMGVHTGQVFVGTVCAAAGRLNGISAFGLDVNLVARLASAASAGEALVTHSTYSSAGRDASASELRVLELKGIEGEVSAVVLGGGTAEATHQSP